MRISTRALAFVSRWFAPATVQQIFEPLVADWQREWQDAPPSRRWWVSVRASLAFACAVAISSPRVMMTPVPRSVAAPVAQRIVIFCVLVAGLLSIPLARSTASRAAELSWPATLLLMALPAALMIVFPFSMIIAVDAIRRESAVALQIRRAAALKLAVIALLFMVIAGGFMVPFANQAWQRVSTPSGWNVPQPTPTELSTWALLTHPDRETALLPRPQYTRAGEIRRVLVNRTVASLLPALLVWVRWAMLSQPRRHRFWPLPAAAMTVVAAIAFFATVLVGFRLEYELSWLPGSGLCLPVAMLMAWALLEQWRAAHPQEA